MKAQHHHIYKVVNTMRAELGNIEEINIEDYFYKKLYHYIMTARKEKCNVIVGRNFNDDQ